VPAGLDQAIAPISRDEPRAATYPHLKRGVQAEPPGWRGDAVQLARPAGGTAIPTQEFLVRRVVFNAVGVGLPEVVRRRCDDQVDRAVS